MTRHERLEQIEQTLAALREQMARLRQEASTLEAEKDRLVRAQYCEGLKARVGQQVRYRLMTIDGDHRFYQKVGRLLAAKRTIGVVDFGEPLGRWRVRLEELEPYPNAAPGTPTPGTCATASPVPGRRQPPHP